MNFNNLNLLDQLQKEKARSIQKENDLLLEANRILSNEQAHEASILENLNRKNNSYDQVKPFRPAPNKVYSLQQIKALCIRYRLRFLDTEFFDAELPYAAIAKIKSLEKQWKTPLSNFKILAPKKMFNLSDADSDPILFLKLDDQRYYFIHQWGGKLSRFRALLAFPLRNLNSMFVLLLGIALMFSLLIPTNSFLLAAFLFVHTFIALCGIACMLVLGFRENFSNIEWNSQYLS